MVVESSILLFVIQVLTDTRSFVLVGFIHLGNYLIFNPLSQGGNTSNITASIFMWILTSLQDFSISEVDSQGINV